jgi:hypothetical protein
LKEKVDEGEGVSRVTTKKENLKKVRRTDERNSTNAPMNEIYKRNMLIELW